MSQGVGMGPKAVVFCRALTQGHLVSPEILRTRLDELDRIAEAQRSQVAGLIESLSDS
jgi:hypothetical protein